MSECYVRKLLSEAVKWDGYVEKASRFNLESYTKNAGSANYTHFADYIYKNYPKWFNADKNGFAWCSVYVQFCHLIAFGFKDAVRITYQPSVNSLSPSCTFAYRYFKNANKFGKQPKVGASVFFTNNGKESGIHHTGIVLGYTDTTVVTQEGNTSNKCAKRTYKRSSSSIFEYGYPDYDIDPNGDPTPTEFIGGGTSMYKKYTDIDLNIPIHDMGTLSKDTKSLGKVTAETLNVRTLPGVNYSQLKSIPFIKKDTIVNVCDAVAASDGAKWYYINTAGKFGFVSAKHIQLVRATTTSLPIIQQDDSGKYSTR